MTERQGHVRKLFGRIAPCYGLLNTVLSFGMHKLWRRAALRLLRPQSTWRCLDVGTGTGDFAVALEDRVAAVTGVDLTPEMLRVAVRRTGGRVPFVIGDALRLPFRPDCFDCATLGFALRHSGENLPALLAEMARVVRPGGHVLTLELSHPPPGLWRRLAELYIYRILPVIGGMADLEAYAYLSESIRALPDAATLSDLLRDAGCRSVQYRLLTGGVAAVHLATV